MKKTLCILIIVCIALPFCACGGKTPIYKAPVTFYYKAKNIPHITLQPVIASEQRESFGHEEDYTHLVEQYLNGPQTAGCISPFPAGTTLDQLDLVKNKVIIVVSSHLVLIEGADLSIACTCLAKTVSEMTGMKTVQIYAKDSLLNGQESITISTDSYVLDDVYVPEK